ncbi:NAD(P)-dependent oxidoreductase [Hoeflea sp. TYP-13]|uniref:NAD(P)-dependent oxidoreductase n=1 Tax=Hoeflea sp. TYP-13 TaxID=3230023 RepID=UPI0034C6AE4C
MPSHPSLPASPELRADRPLPARIQPLAVLPVFFDLNAKRAVVVGGSEAAAWKAELLAAAGARVEVFSPDPSVGVRRLAGSIASNRVTIRQRSWMSACFAEAAVVVADAETNEEAQAIRCAAHDAGVPVNIIDRPRFCDFQFGSIVNRSPAVIGISTDGAAPILGQAIRRRIETLLPPALSGWAALAKRLRGQINARLQPGIQRRLFWERFSDLAFAGECSSDETELASALDTIPEEGDLGQGRVTVVGSAHGDPDLLTIRAARALQGADVILFDDPVAGPLMELARREAQYVFANGGPQETGLKLTDLVRRGKNVVWLTASNPSDCINTRLVTDPLIAGGVDVTIVPDVSVSIRQVPRSESLSVHRQHGWSARYAENARSLPEQCSCRV